VDYFNTHKLNLGNLELTRAWIELGHALRVRRFHFISTAFCSGYRGVAARAGFHGEIPYKGASTSSKPAQIGLSAKTPTKSNGI
jgi:hypothetical protein